MLMDLGFDEFDDDFAAAAADVVAAALWEQLEIEEWEEVLWSHPLLVLAGAAVMLSYKSDEDQICWVL